MMINNLNNYDFEAVGGWKLEKHLNSGITYELHKFERERVIYAFVVDGRVNYIGVCDNTGTTLKDRMNRYKFWQGSGNNKRIANKIKECLEQKKSVEIFALKPELECKYKDLNIDLIKGLENPLIEKLNPDWNRQR